MAEKTPSLDDRLKNLKPEARQRVESALRTTIDAELARELGGGANLQGQFSRGIIFSRIASAAAQDEAIINEAMDMDDQKFARFAERLSTLNQIKGAK